MTVYHAVGIAACVVLIIVSFVGMMKDKRVAQTDAHAHVFGLWAREMIVEKLVGPYGRTESPEYYNVRRCDCGFSEMVKIDTTRRKAS